jgi:hypothetical protein
VAFCPRCHAQQIAKESDLCASCEKDLNAQAEEQQHKEMAAFLAYAGDQYLTKGWLEDGLSLDEAKRIVEDPSYISMAIEMGELAMVLADKYATASLRVLLTQRNEQVLEALRYARLRKRRKNQAVSQRSASRNLCISVSTSFTRRG